MVRAALHLLGNGSCFRWYVYPQAEHLLLTILPQRNISRNGEPHLFFLLKMQSCLNILALADPQVQHLQQEGAQRPADALVDGERPARDWAAVRVPSVVDEAAQGAQAGQGFARTAEVNVCVYSA